MVQRREPDTLLHVDLELSRAALEPELCHVRLHPILARHTEIFKMVASFDAVHQLDASLHGWRLEPLVRYTFQDHLSRWCALYDPGPD